jgi:Mor family transcriptional regulator
MPADPTSESSTRSSSSDGPAVPHPANTGRACFPDNTVEVIGQLSNHDKRSRLRHLHAAAQGQRAGGLTEYLAVPGPSERHQRQIQHRLPVDEGEQLVRDYLAGAKVRDLAARYQVDRNTVIGHVNRAGVRRHYPALLPEEIA